MIGALSALLWGVAVDAAARAGHAVAIPGGGTIRHVDEPARTRLAIQTPRGVHGTLTLARDTTVADKASPSALKVIGTVGRSAVIVIDTYPSRAGGLAACQAGQESFLRVIALTGRQPKETLRIKLESCHENLELDASGVEWRAESATLRIHWLQGPTTPAKAEVRTVRIGLDGKPV